MHAGRTFIPKDYLLLLLPDIDFRLKHTCVQIKFRVFCHFEYKENSEKCSRNTALHKKKSTIMLLHLMPFESILTLSEFFIKQAII